MTVRGTPKMEYKDFVWLLLMDNNRLNNTSYLAQVLPRSVMSSPISQRALTNG